MTEGLGDALVDRLWPGGGVPRDFSSQGEASAAATDPGRWIFENFGEQPWSAQRRICEAVVNYRRVAVASCNGLGKSWIASRLMAWWVMQRPPGQRLALATAPTGSQLRSILWAELREAHRRGGLPGEVGATEWRIGDVAVAIARKSSDFNDPDRAMAAFQGLHRPGGVLVVLDEASGIPDWLWDAAGSLTTGASSRTLAVGNPLRASGRFAQVCAPGSGWHSFAVDAYSTPRFSGEAVSPGLLEALPSQEWIDELASTYGEESATFMSRVLAQFPAQDDDGLISAEWIRGAQETELYPGDGAPVVLGVDVGGGGGGDSTVIVRSDGLVARTVFESKTADTMATAGEVIRVLADDRDGALAVVDATGLGSGVYDRLREQGANVLAFNAAEKARRPERFKNRRAEAFWELREKLREGLIDLDPDDEALAGELLGIRWSTDSAGRTVIESKSDARSRGVSSPDHADALAMAVAAGSRAAVPIVAFGPGLTYTGDLLNMSRDAW
ncbi:MAG TPA: hypothetical protein VND98_06195 [Solirubrobacterales bacterium]|nr:hypothetical protein [Solirubrobacterales bacterium]